MARGRRLQPELRRQLRVRRLDQHAAVAELDRRDDALALVDLDHMLLAGRILLDVDPLIRDLMLPQKLLAAAAIRAPVGAIDRDLGVGGLGHDVSLGLRRPEYDTAPLRKSFHFPHAAFSPGGFCSRTARMGTDSADHLPLPDAPRHPC
jgi:hypothetical protein